jgi:hypothetical protein
VLLCYLDDQHVARSVLDDVAADRAQQQPLERPHAAPPNQNGVNLLFLRGDHDTVPGVIRRGQQKVHVLHSRLVRCPRVLAKQRLGRVVNLVLRVDDKVRRDVRVGVELRVDALCHGQQRHVVLLVRHRQAVIEGRLCR